MSDSEDQRLSPEESKGKLPSTKYVKAHTVIMVPCERLLARLTWVVMN